MNGQAGVQAGVAGRRWAVRQGTGPGEAHTQWAKKVQKYTQSTVQRGRARVLPARLGSLGSRRWGGNRTQGPVKAK